MARNIVGAVVEKDKDKNCETVLLSLIFSLFSLLLLSFTLFNCPHMVSIYRSPAGLQRLIMSLYQNDKMHVV